MPKNKYIAKAQKRKRRNLLKMHHKLEMKRLELKEIEGRIDEKLKMLGTSLPKLAKEYQRGGRK